MTEVECPPSVKSPQLAPPEESLKRVAAESRFESIGIELHLRYPAGIAGTAADPTGKVGRMNSSLRFFSPDDATPPATPQVAMTVGEFCQILSHACDSNRTWLQDFDREEIWVSEDLFVVMQAYWNLNSAA